MTKDNLILEDLQCNGLFIYQTKNGYRFTSDAVALANYLTVKSNGVLVDLCSGSGVIGILANAKNIIKKTYLVEIQKNLAEMSLQSLHYNHIDNIEVINKPIQDIHRQLGVNLVDTVVCNPPYFDKDKKTKDSKEISIARHELLVSLEEIIIEASQLLKQGGKLYLSHKENRLCDIIEFCRKYGIEPKEVKVLKSCKGENEILFKGIKGGKVGFKIT